MIASHDFVKYLDSYLAIDDIPDGYWNGLQIEGAQEINKIAFAVDACQATFEKTIESNAQILITHHGHFSKKNNPSLVGWKKQRIETALHNTVSLYVAHLPLDRHPEVGNNAQLLQLLNARIEKEFLFEKGKNIGWIGILHQSQPIQKIEKILQDQLNADTKTIPFGPKEIKTIAVCSGGGGYGGFWQALEQNVDLYITGDRSDIYQVAQDAKINVIFAGHYATETIGLQALAKHIEKQFTVETIFIDAPTGL